MPPPAALPLREVSAGVATPLPPTVEEESADDKLPVRRDKEPEPPSMIFLAKEGEGTEATAAAEEEAGEEESAAEGSR